MKPNNLSLQVHFSSHEGAPAAIYAEELVVKMQELLRREPLLGVGNELYCTVLYCTIHLLGELWTDIVLYFPMKIRL